MRAATALVKFAMPLAKYVLITIPVFPAYRITLWMQIIIVFKNVEVGIMKGTNNSLIMAHASNVR